MAEKSVVSIKRQHEPDSDEPVENKIAKPDTDLEGGTRGFRKCAIVMVYSGWGYFGMQR